MIHCSSKKFHPSEIRIMNLDGSDKPCVCRNALQTSLIREKIRRRISSTINCEIQNRLQNYNFFWTISNNLQKNRILYNPFNIKKGQGTVMILLLIPHFSFLIAYCSLWYWLPASSEDYDQNP